MGRFVVIDGKTGKPVAIPMPNPRAARALAALMSHPQHGTGRRYCLAFKRNSHIEPIRSAVSGRIKCFVSGISDDRDELGRPPKRKRRKRKRGVRYYR